MRASAFADALRKYGLTANSREALIMIAIAQVMIELRVEPTDPAFVKAINMLAQAVNDSAAHMAPSGGVQ